MDLLYKYKNRSLYLYVAQLITKRWEDRMSVVTIYIGKNKHERSFVKEMKMKR